MNALYEEVGPLKSIICWFLTVTQASPLPQAAHIGVSWVQRPANINQEAEMKQDGEALQSRHGPGKEKKKKNPNMSHSQKTFEKQRITGKRQR